MDEGEYALKWTLFEQAGVVASRQAEELIGRARARRHLRQGRWRSVCRGVLVAQNGPLSRDQQLWVAVLAAGPPAWLAGSTAATVSGIRGLPAEPLHVLISGNRRRSERLSGLPHDMPEVRVHRSSVLPPEHLRLGRPPRTSTARAVVDAAAWSGSDRAAQMIILSACQQRRVRTTTVRDVLAVLPVVRRRRLITMTIADAEGGTEALSEADFLLLCRRNGLPRPELQFRRKDADGRNRYLDAYWPDARLHVEIDGAHHMDVREWSADMVRQNQLWIAGERVLRFPAWLVRSNPSLVAAQLRSALAASLPP